MVFLSSLGDIDMKKRLAIIGANEAITMLIQKAKDLGYETHVFAWQCGDPGEKVADFFYPISIDRKEDILNTCKEIGISGICSITSDYAAPTVNYIANCLGLPCNDITTNDLARNKFLMRKALQDAGLYTPKFIEVDSNFKLDEDFKISYPVIVKPTDRWSSKGVTRVNNSLQLKDSVENAIKTSLEKKAIIEEFMEGDEYSAECICHNGKYNILAFTKKRTTGYPHYIETGHEQPANISLSLLPTIKEKLFKGLNALGIRNGAAHIEFKILNNYEVGIIEIGARMGGDCIGTDLTPISTGMDYIKMVIDVACGENLDFEVRQKPYPVEIRFIIDKKDYEQYLSVLENDTSCIIKTGEIDCNFSNGVIDSSTRHGYYILKHSI